MPRATMNPLIFSLSLVILAALPGCGTKTPLTKPAGPVTPPIFGAPTAPAPTPVPRDDSNKPAAVAP